jgi:hypothetical protein
MQNPVPLTPYMYDWVTADAITPYDRDHMIPYLRTLDAHAEGTAWETRAYSCTSIPNTSRPAPSGLTRAISLGRNG